MTLCNFSERHTVENIFHKCSSTYHPEVFAWIQTNLRRNQEAVFTSAPANLANFSCNEQRPHQVVSGKGGYCKDRQGEGEWTVPNPSQLGGLPDLLSASWASQPLSHDRASLCMIPLLPSAGVSPVLCPRAKLCMGLSYVYSSLSASCIGTEVSTRWVS